MSRPGQRRASRLRALIPAALCAVVGALGAAPAHALPPGPDLARLGGRGAPIHEELARPPALRTRGREARDGFNAVLTATTGYRVHVVLAPAYSHPHADVLAASWAEFLAHLVHGPELATVTAYVAPPEEVAPLCGAEADACYQPEGATMVLPGEPPPTGVAVEELAAHEYGHHVAASRSDAPWDAFDWGPKHWASAVGVCARASAGTAFPGDDGSHYRLDPGEGFAEAYRMLNGGAWRGLLDDSFTPDAGALEAVRRDVLSPWTGPGRQVLAGRLSARGPAVWRATLPTPLDGRLAVTLRAPASAGLQVVVLDAGDGRMLARAHSHRRQVRVRAGTAGRSARRRHARRHRRRAIVRTAVTFDRSVSVTVCGQRAVRAEVRRRAGRSAAFSLTAVTP